MFQLCVSLSLRGEWEKTGFGQITTPFSLRNKEEITYPMYSVTNSRGFVSQQDLFEGREMVGEDLKSYKIIHYNDFAYNPARINVGSIAHYLCKKPCMISSLYVCFKANKNIYGRWLSHLLKTPKNIYYYNVNGEGGVRIYLFYPNFARIKTSIPCICEQEKITVFLDLIDQRISTQNKIIAKQQSFITGVTKILLRPSNNWMKTTIGDVLSIGSGKDYKHLNNGDVPVYGTGGYMLSVDDYLYDGESVCIGRKGTINSPMFFKGKFWTVDTLFYTYNFKNILPKYCYYLFKTINWLEYNEASGVPSLSKDTIQKIKICIPPIDTQTLICNLLSPLESKLQIEKSLLEQLNSQKRFLLSQMFI